MKTKIVKTTLKKIIFSFIGFLFFSQTSIAQYSAWEMVYSETQELAMIKGFSFVPGSNGLWETGYAAQFDGSILKTTNGGETWVSLSAIVPEFIWGISFADENIGYVAGQSGSVYKTTNGGTSWTAVYTIVGGSFSKVAFKDANNGVAAGYPYTIYTSNGGTTWDIGTDGTNNFWGLDYASGNTYYGVEAFTGVVGRSNNNGQTWTEAHNTDSDITICVNFFDTSHGVVGCSGGVVQVTNDGGTTWEEHTISPVEILAASWFDADTVWASGDGVFKSTDQGATWVTDTTIFAPGLYNREMFVTGFNTILVAGASLGTNEIQIWRKVGPPPVQANFIADPETVCTGGTVDFTDTSVGAIDSWNWTFEGGTPATSTLQNPTVTYNTPGEYDVKLVVSVGAILDSIIKVNYINAVLLPEQANQPAGDTDLCTGLTYEYSTEEVTYAVDYDWEVTPSNAGVITWNMNTATLDVSDTWTGNFTIKVRASNVCGDGPWSNDLMGEVHGSPEPYDVIGGGEICEGGEGLEVELNNSETGVDYELYKNEVATGNIVAGTGEAISFGLINEAGNYTVLGYTDYCSTVQYGEASITISVLPVQLAMPTGTTEVCNNEESSYTTTGGQETDNIIWTLSPENAGEISSDGMSATIMWNTAFEGDALLSVLAENSCGEGPVSDALEILVMSSPAPDVMGDDLVCKEEVSIYSTTVNEGSNYEWEAIGGTITSGEGTHEITVTWGNTPGMAYVIVNESLELGCSAVDTLAVTIDDCTGIEDFSKDNKLSIFPNPATDFISIKSQVKIISVSILNSEAKILLSEEVNGYESKMNTADLKAGMYFIRVLSENETIIKKLVIK
ncbi:MAG TPA: T9SS type A sorting domain-containing protein [Bacteroidales bacterium]